MAQAVMLKRNCGDSEIEKAMLLKQHNIVTTPFNTVFSRGYRVVAVDA
jgi:hypothetical protein